FTARRSSSSPRRPTKARMRSSSRAFCSTKERAGDISPPQPGAAGDRREEVRTTLRVSAAAPPRLAKMPGMDLPVEFFRHNAMMNQRLVEACRQLPPEQLGATATGTYGSIGATLVHIANSQVGYAA